MMDELDEIKLLLKRYNQKIKFSRSPIAVVLGAGHGKRIKSATSKMLHEIWGVPTIKRVIRSVKSGLQSQNQIVVVGIKAADVMNALSGEKGHFFVYQGLQKGTGHAVQQAVKIFPQRLAADVYIFPGDMGIITAEAIRKFKNDFEKSAADMMVLTSIYEGPADKNYYGRIVRVPPTDRNGVPAGEEKGKVIEIKEYKDILALAEDKSYEIRFKGRFYSFSKKTLIENSEYNSGVFAFKGRHLKAHVSSIRANNVQHEIYLTDLIEIFNRRGLSVQASRVMDSTVTLAFNNKSVLKEMESIVRRNIYEQLKDIVSIKDEDNFYISEEGVSQILSLDKTAPLDITLEEGVHLGPGVKINRGLVVKTNATLEGNIVLGQNVVIHENVVLSTYPNQQLKIGDETQIFAGDIVKGNITIGKQVRIESGVNITGSDEFPVWIGDHVLIKGTSYIFGSRIENEVQIEHSILIRKFVRRIVKLDGLVQKVRYVLPQPEGLDSITEIPHA